MMRSFFLWPLLLFALFQGYGSVDAQEAPEPETGKILILLNGQVMEGDIARTETQVCIRRGTSELFISRQKALRICADWNDAYAYLRSRLDPLNASDHISLARWCYTNNLHEYALAEAKKALEIQPINSDAKQIVATLQRAKLEKPPVSTPMPVRPTKQIEAAAAPDVTYDTLVSFATRVQPILMNTCATCHSTNRGGDFHLERVSSLAQKVATEQNLSRVLRYIDVERPAISPLLVKAVLPHWKGQQRQAPIKDREAKAFQTVQEWISQTIMHNPHLQDYAAKKKQFEETRSSSGATTVPGKGISLTSQKDEAVGRSGPTNRVPSQAVATPNVQDCHDPEIFNNLPKR